MLKSRRVPVFSHSVWVALLGLSACADLPPHAVIPDAIATPADQVLALEAMAAGVQIYECKGNGESPAKFQWVLKAPEAELYDASGSRIARHYAGPTWEASDGSKVVGEVKAQFTSLDPSAVSWLLLSAKSNVGQGVFAKTVSIQRINTKGGKPPTTECNQALSGKLSRVPYTATYNFYNTKP
jgi:hypothetical protein